MTNAVTPDAGGTDPAIDRLLATAEPVSIVDGLFELGDEGAGDTVDDWGRMVTNRLQARLASRIRHMLSVRAR